MNLCGTCLVPTLEGLADSPFVHEMTSNVVAKLEAIVVARLDAHAAVIVQALTSNVNVRS